MNDDQKDVDGMGRYVSSYYHSLFLKELTNITETLGQYK
jgi:hypothetical protein